MVHGFRSFIPLYLAKWRLLRGKLGRLKIRRRDASTGRKTIHHDKIDEKDHGGAKAETMPGLIYGQFTVPGNTGVHSGTFGIAFFR